MTRKQSMIALALGWFLVVCATGATGVRAQDAAVAAPTESPATLNRDVTDESSSPSQEARERINQIRRNEFFYQSFGKPDPFGVLVSGDYQPATGAELVDLNTARLVGVMWGADDHFALVEDTDGFGYILRLGDRVRNGRVTAVSEDRLTARVVLYGIANTVVLKLDRTEG
ncbi:MAG: hypothetical protein R6X25_01630 [Candidatus Krumholzibacteriia bacterium]